MYPNQNNGQQPPQQPQQGVPHTPPPQPTFNPYDQQQFAQSRPQNSTGFDQPQPMQSAPIQGDQPTPEPTAPPKELSDASIASQGEYGVDFLNELASSGNAPTQEPNKLLVFGGIGAVLVLAGAVLFFMFQSPKASSNTEREVYATMIDTANVTKNAGKNISGSRLSGANSTLNNLLLGSVQKAQDPFTKSGIDIKEAEKAAKEQYHDQGLVDKLEDARLNDVYDNVYAQQMSYKIQSILLLLDKIEKNNKREAVQDYVKDAKGNFESIKNDIETINREGESSY